MAEEKVCKCKVEMNHMVSMALMLMEGIADGDWNRAKLYRELTEMAIKDTGRCAGVEMTSALASMENAKEFLEKREIRPVMRTLQDAFWYTVAEACK